MRMGAKIKRSGNGSGKDRAQKNWRARMSRTAGGRGAPRDAIGGEDKEIGKWQRKRPDPTELERTDEPHARGAILVAAVFDAFLAIYNSRIGDLKRIATGGSGLLPAGDIHP